MLKIKLNENEKRNLYIYSLAGIIVVVSAFILFKIGSLFAFVRNFISVLSPFLWGLAFSFILSRFADLLERKLPSKFKKKTKRFLSSLLAILLLIACITVFVLIISPQLVDSVSKLSKAMVKFTANPGDWIKMVELNTNLPKQAIEAMYDYSNTLVSSIWKALQNAVPDIVNLTIDTVSGVLNFVIGFIVALYILIDRDNIIGRIRRFCKAFLSKKHYVNLTVIYNVAISKFYRFFKGKLIDSLIIGVLCLIIMAIFRLDYALLISVIVCITNIIPFFGPFIGAIPSALFLLMSDPSQALVFVIIILVLQQIDGNIIGPSILGDSVGLSSLWIMFAIIVGSAYFGFAGMILGVPILSVVYYLVNEEIDKRLNNKVSKTRKTK